MDILYRDERVVRNQIIYLMKGENEGVSFGTLLSVLDMSDNDRDFLHNLLLDLCKEGYLKQKDNSSNSMDEMTFFPGDDEKINQYSDRAEPVSTSESQSTDTKEPTVKNGKTEEIVPDETAQLANAAQPKEESETLSEDTNACDYGMKLYKQLLLTLKMGEEWKTIRDLLSREAWPKEKEICSILPKLLIQMALEGIIEIRTEKDTISSVRPSIRYCGENKEEKSEEIMAILRGIQIQETEEEAAYEEELPAKKDTSLERIPTVLPVVTGEEVKAPEQDEVSEKEKSEEAESPNTKSNTKEDTGDSDQNNDQSDNDWEERAQVPFGYKNTPEGFAIIESEAEIIRAIFKMRSRKMILQAIADRLNALGIKSKTGKQFYPATISDILRKHKLYQGKKMSRGLLFPVILDDQFLDRFNSIADKDTAVSVDKKRAEHKQVRAESTKEETLPEKRSEFASISTTEPIQVPTSQEEIQEEIYRILYEVPGFHSIEVIKSLSAKLINVPDYKIIFNANMLKSRNLIDEIITSSPDPVMYLYAAKVQAQTPVKTNVPEQKEETVQEKTASQSRQVREFIEYCKTTPLAYAYKMILILAFMQKADQNGTMHIEETIEYFKEYYNDRRNRGLKVEKGNTIFSDPKASDSQLKRNILDNPVKALTGGGYFRYDTQSCLFSMRSFVWVRLTSSDRQEIESVCKERLEKYFSNL